MKLLLFILVVVVLVVVCLFVFKDGKGLFLGLVFLEGVGVCCIDFGIRDSWVCVFFFLKFEIKIFLVKELINDFVYLS